MNGKVRYIRYEGPIAATEIERLHKTKLYQSGDTVLVWVNQGDLCMHGESMEPRNPTYDELKRALEYVENNSGAHPENVKKVVHDALHPNTVMR